MLFHVLQALIVTTLVGCLVETVEPDVGARYSCQVRARIADTTTIVRASYDVCSVSRDDAVDAATARCLVELDAAFCDVSCDGKLDDAGALEVCKIVQP